MLALVNDIIRYRAPAVTQNEQSPVGSSGSNGVVERGVQSFEMMARVMKDALETKWKVSIPDDHAVLPWMIGYSSYLVIMSIQWVFYGIHIRSHWYTAVFPI